MSAYYKDIKSGFPSIFVFNGEDKKTENKKLLSLLSSVVDENSKKVLEKINAGALDPDDFKKQANYRSRLFQAQLTSLSFFSLTKEFGNNSQGISFELNKLTGKDLTILTPALLGAGHRVVAVDQFLDIIANTLKKFEDITTTATFVSLALYDLSTEAGDKTAIRISAFTLDPPPPPPQPETGIHLKPLPPPPPPKHILKLLHATEYEFNPVATIPSSNLKFLTFFPTINEKAEVAPIAPPIDDHDTPASDTTTESDDVGTHAHGSSFDHILP